MECPFSGQKLRFNSNRSMAPREPTRDGRTENSTDTRHQYVELTPEQKRIKIEREILYLRHKLQKGFLTRDVQPKAEEMEQMSGFLSKLEQHSSLEASAIRFTKIHKVLKHILRLDEIPKDSDFQIKNRSRCLFEKFKKTLDSAEQSLAPESIPTNPLQPVPAGTIPVTADNNALSSSKIEAELIDRWVLVFRAGDEDVVMKEEGHHEEL